MGVLGVVIIIMVVAVLTISIGLLIKNSNIWITGIIVAAANALFGFGMACCLTEESERIVQIGQCEVLEAEIGVVVISHYGDDYHDVEYVTDPFELRNIEGKPLYMYQKYTSNAYGVERSARYYWSVNPDEETEEVLEN